MHYAVHGHTAAEIVVKRADSQKPLMGLTSFKGNYITSQDVKIAKNYLSEKELNQLNLIVLMYLANAGSISSGQAAQKAEEEFENYRKEIGKDYISDFDKAVKKLAHRKENKRRKK